MIDMVSAVAVGCFDTAVGGEVGVGGGHLASGGEAEKGREGDADCKTDEGSFHLSIKLMKSAADRAIPSNRLKPM
jgi:hypothetical protein